MARIARRKKVRDDERKSGRAERVQSTKTKDTRSPAENTPFMYLAFRGRQRLPLNRHPLDLYNSRFALRPIDWISRKNTGIHCCDGKRKRRFTTIHNLRANIFTCMVTMLFTNIVFAISLSESLRGTVSPIKIITPRIYQASPRHGYGLPERDAFRFPYVLSANCGIY